VVHTGVLPVRMERESHADPRQVKAPHSRPENPPGLLASRGRLPVGDGARPAGAGQIGKV
jgi:hypothetical protein